jgi:2,4-dienoyl-CoA reductase-like NADH-dependent reductase (Old Yellow Enzyme family)
MTSFPQLSNCRLSPRLRRGLSRFGYPDVAEDLINSGDADAILLSRQMIADEQWLTKVKQGREKDIRRCVAANILLALRSPRQPCAMRL